jgi:hypothetical protein
MSLPWLRETPKRPRGLYIALALLWTLVLWSHARHNQAVRLTTYSVGQNDGQVACSVELVVNALPFHVTVPETAELRRVCWRFGGGSACHEELYL